MYIITEQLQDGWLCLGGTLQVEFTVDIGLQGIFF